MAHYIFIWFGCLIFFVLVGVLVAPTGRKGDTNSVLDVLSDSETAANVEKYINTEPKSWSAKKRLFLEQSRTGVTFESFMIVLVGSIVGCFAIGLFLLHNVFFAIVFSAIGYLVPNSYVKRKRDKVLEVFDAELIRPLDRMIAVLSASKTPSQAVAEIAHATDMPRITQIEFEQAYVEMEFGKTIEDSFYSMAERTGSENVLFIATQMAINREQGGNMADVLHKIRSSISERIRLKRDLRSITAEQRSQANMIVMVFIGIMLATLFIEPNLKQMLFQTVTGRFLVTFAAFMMLIGSFIIRKMTS